MDSSSLDLALYTDRLAEIAVKIGVNLQPQQELIVNAPVEAVDLVRAIATHAYRAGAKNVAVNFADETLSRIQAVEGSDAIFDYAPAWRYDALYRVATEGAAFLTVFGADPNLLAGCDPARLARSQKSNAVAAQAFRGLLGGFKNRWSIIPFAHQAWAQAVFPGRPEAIDLLWSAIFAATRVASDDPVANWQAHVGQLHARAALLNQKRFAALHFTGPGTDLRVGLVDGHVWAGGAVDAADGLRCLPNLPTEEVFTMPHRDRVDGVVRATKPLSFQGSLIEGIEVRFEAGRIVAANASAGAAIFRNLIATDEGAARLGEVALVPDASPISRSGLLFQNTLFDENAASHIAIGRAFGINLAGGQIDGVAGANQSVVHVDWMIGSGEIDVDGLHANGDVEPVMRKGAFTVAVG